MNFSQDFLTFVYQKLRLLSTPFDVDEFKVPENYEMKVIELKSFACENLLNFYKEILSSDEYPNLIRNATDK